ncbi:MAG: hypothetical protein HW385_1447 [candidate division NC10 bacterium]|nr:hypothetical protein [candidate division NC10 bacterium]
MRVNRKSIAQTRQHPDRNEQFHYIARLKQEFQDRGQPHISVDSKKRELVGPFYNKGRAWRQEAAEVFTHDFPSYASGVALLYGIYEPIRNKGTMVVGTSHDTPAFAVDAIGLWLKTFGWSAYPAMTDLLITCDGGGSNSCRARLWKLALYHRLFREHGIKVTVCHYPTGASKYNPIERRLFSFVTLNWAGVPLRDYETILNRIRTTKTTPGLSVEAILNTADYPLGIKVDDVQMQKVDPDYHGTLPRWNYTIGN